jgi:hypothetical protein
MPMLHIPAPDYQNDVIMEKLRILDKEVGPMGEDYKRYMNSSETNTNL